MAVTASTGRTCISSIHNEPHRSLRAFSINVNSEGLIDGSSCKGLQFILEHSLIGASALTEIAWAKFRLSNVARKSSSLSLFSSRDCGAGFRPLAPRDPAAPGTSGANSNYLSGSPRNYRAHLHIAITTYNNIRVPLNRAARRPARDQLEHVRYRGSRTFTKSRCRFPSPSHSLVGFVPRLVSIIVHVCIVHEYVCRFWAFMMLSENVFFHFYNFCKSWLLFIAIKFIRVWEIFQWLILMNFDDLGIIIIW